MKLERLYSNRPEIFEEVRFNDGFSAVLAEIRKPENMDLDTHNLGKSTVGALLDFCLLKGKSKRFFLFANGDIFREFVFFLEVMLPDGRFLTIRRAVDPGTRVDLAISDVPIDGEGDESVVWEHTNLTLARAKLIVDGLLSFDVLKPWGLRQVIGYLIRSQSDYGDVFQLDKNSGKHLEWKPFVAQLIGMDGERAMALYQTRDDVEQYRERIKTLKAEWGGVEVDSSVLSGLIANKRREVKEKETAVEAFSFHGDDVERVRVLVDETEQEIARLNEDSYRLRQLAVRLEESLAEDQIVFRPSEAEGLFAEAGIAFGDQVKHTFESLIAFNREISEERRGYLAAQYAEVLEEQEATDARLEELDRIRRDVLGVLRESDSLEKYRDVSLELTDLKAELQALEARRVAADRLLDLKQELREKEEDFNRLKSETETEIVAVSSDDEGRFGLLRRYFGDIVNEVLGQRALLAMHLNASGGIDFVADFIDDSGTATAGGEGLTYKKTMCIAFDLALLRAYGDAPFPRFVYHDGAFEQLESRKRQKLLAVFREYSELGFQPIVSLLDFEVPRGSAASADRLSDGEVIVTLHDEGESGRLFKTESW
ncbi:DUF2326 domain-containing protein [Demequina zhanjiangensis]|uniref:DUF2326 domain-containing protein n=1 Tax=Demequina zhanjiangensis TaxID=3051659 RepID=A0ABT8G1J9_9MICO|nr:DUF2326 domain-containing protein [Demequina sp. SYSU T00b26]MDN4472882.1 DUF2326 domain-containing protein [Demequina sp. SYSU T00b26]